MKGYNSSYVPPIGERLGAGISYFIFSLYGTCANILVGYALYKNQKFFLRYPFYVLAIHLLLASLGVLFGQYVLTIPLSLSGRPLYGTGSLMIALASMDTFFFLTIFFVSFLISLNRFCSLFSPRLHHFLFEDHRIHITCLIPWLLGGLWVLLSILADCPKIFRHDMFYYTYRCPDPFTHSYQRVFMDVTTQLGYIGPAIMMLFYVAVIIYIRYNKTEQENYASQLNMLIQALLICSAFEIETLLFTFLPDFTNSWGIYWVSLLLDYALIFNASLNPTIMIVMNKKIRAFIKDLFIKKPPPEDSLYVVSNMKIYELSSTF